MMRKAEDASPLTPEQLVRLRSLPLAELLPLGEDLAELFRASYHLLRDVTDLAFALALALALTSSASVTLRLNTGKARLTGSPGPEMRRNIPRRTAP
jgi:hypothetical protein